MAAQTNELKLKVSQLKPSQFNSSHIESTGGSNLYLRSTNLKDRSAAYSFNRLSHLLGHLDMVTTLLDLWMNPKLKQLGTIYF